MLLRHKLTQDMGIALVDDVHLYQQMVGNRNFSFRQVQIFHL